MSDDLMQRLTTARPVTPPGLLDPDPQLLEEILMTTPITTRRIVTPFRLAGAAAVVTAGALLVINVAAPTTSTVWRRATCGRRISCRCPTSTSAWAAIPRAA